MISPVLFIPMLERSGHIINFTKNAIHTALHQLHSWHRAEMTVSVNASAKNIQDDNLPHIIGSALSIWNVKPERLIIEVTESGVISDKRTGFKVLNAIRDLGVGVSIDDFCDWLKLYQAELAKNNRVKG